MNSFSVGEADRPNLTLRILPLDAQHTVFGESFVIFGFGADSAARLQDVVSTEHMRSGSSWRGSGDLPSQHRVSDACRAALDPAASKRLIMETAESHWSGARRALARNWRKSFHPLAAVTVH